jgi:site-specific DNA-cytosine methylase
MEDEYPIIKMEPLSTVSYVLKKKFKLLDCFCGMGGVSDGFAQEGFDVTGIDIVDAPKMLGYKHKFIQADMATLKGEDYRRFDVIWGSPPCRNFTSIGRIARNWKEPLNVEKGLELIKCFLKFIEDAKPQYWIMENVPGLQKHLKIKPRSVSLIKPNMRRLFYGNYPLTLIPRTEKWIAVQKQRPRAIRSWKSARIPLACSRAFARACREELERLEREKA